MNNAASIGLLGVALMFLGLFMATDAGLFMFCIGLLALYAGMQKV